MVAYNFKQQFVPLIESGQKRQTIRALGKRRPPVPGEKLQIYTGQRTKRCRKLLDPDPLCRSVEPIAIEAGGIVFLAQQQLSEAEITELAIADGFATTTEFFQFFQQTHGLPFRGVLIKW